MEQLEPGRRDLLVGALVSAMAAGLAGKAEAGVLDPAQTIIVPKDAIPWKPHPIYGGHVQEFANLAGDPNQPGLYLTLIRWHVGYMSIPHMYDFDRICMVLSGVWWCNSGADFDPQNAVPVAAGGFVRRVAGTPHYDGTRSGAPVPAEVAVFGMGPVNYKAADPAMKQGYMRG